jgi:hypothetical protein
MFRLRNAAIALLAVGALALAGCAGQERSTAEKAEPDVMTLLRTEVQASLQNAAEKTEKSKSVAFTMNVTAQGTQVTGKGALSYGPPLAMTMTMNTAGTTLESRLVGNVMYTKLPATALPPNAAGKPWVKIDLAEVAEMNGMDASQFTEQLEKCDPAKQIKNLLATGKLTVVGEETVDGVRAVHYKGTMLVDEYLKQVNPGMRAKQKANLDKLGVKDVVTELWVDEKYQPRKIDLTMGTIRTQVTYRDFGKPVTVSAPPAAETTSLAEMRQSVPA